MNILTSEQQFQLLTELTPDWFLEEPDVNFPPSTPRSHRPLKSIRNLMAATLMLDCGLRVGELVQLTYNDCYFNHNAVNTLVIRAEISKGHHERTIPLTRRTKQVLNLSRSYFMPSIADPPRQYMFFARNWDTHITTRQIERIITTASMKAFGYPITPHMLRHTYATKLMRITDIRTVQELLGHKNVSSTQIYTHVNSDDLKEAVKRIDETDLEFSRPFPLAKL